MHLFSIIWISILKLIVDWANVASVGIYWNLESGNMYSSFQFPVFQWVVHWNTNGTLEHWNIGTLEFDFKILEYMNFININYVILKFLCRIFVEIWWIFVKSLIQIENIQIYESSWIALSGYLIMLSEVNHSAGNILIMLAGIKSHVALVFQCSIKYFSGIPVFQFPVPVKISLETGISHHWVKPV